MTENHERARIHVSGRVQGVFFRDATRRMARKLGLAGWVRNLPDGRVEALFEGPSDEVRQAVRWCEEGTPEADVERVEVEYEDASGDVTGFEVR